jgi:predicted RNA-binding protein
MVNFWICPTPIEHWEQVKTHNIYAFQHETDRDKIKPGDKTIFYLIRSDPPVFVGVYAVTKSWEEAKEPFWAQEKSDGRVIWPWRFQLAPLRLGAVDARKLSKQLSYVESKNAWHSYFMGALANFGRPIPENDYRLIFDELTKSPINYQVKPATKPKTPKVTKVLKRGKIPNLHGPVPSQSKGRVSDSWAGAFSCLTLTLTRRS